MNTLIIIFGSLIVFLLIGGIVVLRKVLATQQQAQADAEIPDGPDEYALRQEERMRQLRVEIQELSKSLDGRLREHQRDVQTSVHRTTQQSLKAIQDVTEKLVRLDETNKQVIGFTEQLQNLQNMLKNPKQRGILGEYYLETTLKNVLPPGTYSLQYKITDGAVVDAVVHVKDKVIPVDSKFSLDNYQRIVEAQNDVEKKQFEQAFKNDLKLRIDETSKYILPEHGTMDFAFMFIPHEAIYYDLLVNEIGSVKVNTQDLIEYAFRKNVMIVSPTSFLAFLQTVLHGLRALQIEESAKEIQKQVRNLGRHLSAYDEFHGKLGKSLSTVVNHYNRSNKEFNKIEKDVLKITGESIDATIEGVDKPLLEN